MARVCDDCPEHSEVKKVQEKRDEEQRKQWEKIEIVERCANTAKRIAAEKVGPGFVILALGIVLAVCSIGFKVIYEQNSMISASLQNVKERLITVETTLKEHDKYDSRRQNE